MIDKAFDVSSVGTVVAGTDVDKKKLITTGTVVSGTVFPNSELLLGPVDVEGTFTPVTITSIHKKRVPVNQVINPAQ